MRDLVFNPLKTMSLEEIREKIRLSNDPIVRFACLREELERISYNENDRFTGNKGSVQMARNRLTWPN